MDDQQAIERAHRAYSELTEIQATFDKMRTALIERWAATGFDKTDHREKLFNAYSTINSVERALRESVDAGRVSTNALEMAALLQPR